MFARVLILTALFALPTWSANGILQIRDGYFWDPAKQEYFVPRGIAYQLWNPPVGADQSFEQLDYDLLEFKKLHVNSVRCEMVWGELEIAEGQYDWSKPDYLVAQAEKLGLKLFVLIGFQYPPEWFPREYLGINAEGLTPKAMIQLPNASASEAFGVFPARTVQELEKVLGTQQLRDTAAAALVEGAKGGSVTNVLRLLQTRLPSDLAIKVSRLMISDVINWEHPRARDLYARHLAAVAGRYRNSAAIGGWVMGNEYAYFDLWEDPNIYAVHRFIGYDSYSQEAFRNYLRLHYSGNIAALNANWGTDYLDFSGVQMPEKYPLDRYDPGYHDLIQWRKRSIGDFVGLGAAAARAVDPDHLQSYSMVGGIFSGRDANNTAEDAKAIVARCRAAGAPLDFWSINNYANAAIGSEMRSGDFGVAKYQAESGLPVMISETGHSSTESLFDWPDAGRRQAKALPGQLWESLVSGAIGTHLFHWSDRNQFTEKYFLRERGFGIVEQNRKIKPEVYTNVAKMFRRMGEVNLDGLMGGSLNPPVDVQFFWSTNADLVWPRANQENAMLWGSLKRAGFQPGIIDDAAFEAGAFTNAPALVLSRAYQMNPEHLAAIGARVLAAGVDVHANADLPGRFDAFHRPNANWGSLMNSIFGLDVSRAAHSWHGVVTNEDHRLIELRGAGTLAPLVPSYAASLFTWTIWEGVAAGSGTALLTHNGLANAAANSAALVIKQHARARTALNTFALGDSGSAGSKEEGWDIRHDWVRAIYQNYFGITPRIQLAGPYSKHVIPDYRILNDGSLLLSLLNEGTNTAQVTLAAGELLAGKTIENLTAGGRVERGPDGSLAFTLEADDYVLLHAHNDAAKPLVWIESAPVVVHPREEPYFVEVGFETRSAGAHLSLTFEHTNGRIVSRSESVAAIGKGQKLFSIWIPDADHENPEYRSSRDGGSYVFRVIVREDSGRAREVSVPVRLAWAVRPLVALPASALPNRVYPVSLEWEELPSPDRSDPAPFERARVWDSVDPRQAYVVGLRVLGLDGVAVASGEFVTRDGSGTNEFAMAIPRTASGPFTWKADVRPVLLQTQDMFESFEGHERGARWPDDLATQFLAPWTGVKYPPENIAGIDIWQNEGVQLAGSHGSHSAFLVVTNPPGLADGLFGIRWEFPGGPWALPQDRVQWTNWSIAFDFQERNGYPAILEAQLKNEDSNGEGKWIQKSFAYTPGSNGWMHVQVNAAELMPPEGLPGPFDPNAVKELVLIARMREPGVQYVGSFDHIVFDGPDEIVMRGAPAGVYGSANDSAGVLTARRDVSGQVWISWTGPGRLQWAEQVEGPWQAGSETNPQPLDVSAPRRFYRLLR